jgi:tetratricopeptide (TPR) repeat protein
MFGVKKGDEEYYELAVKSFESGEYEKSLEYIDKAIDIRPLNAVYLFHRIDIQVAMGDYGSALRELNRMESVYKNNPEIYSYKSLCYYSLEDYNNSIKYAELSINIDHNNEEAYFTKGASLKKLNRYDEAMKALEMCLKINMADSDAHSELAQIYLIKGQKARAISEAKLAIKYDRKNEDAYNTLLSIYLFDEKPEKYIETTGQVFKNTGEFRYLYGMNDFLRMLGMHKTGEEIYKHYIKLYPDVNTFYDLLADILISEGKKDEAYDTYRRILKNGNIEAYRQWFDFLIENGQYKDAIEEIKRFGKEDREILTSLYFAYDSLKDFDNSLLTARKLCEEYDDEEAKLLYAKQLNNTGSMDKALEYLNSYESGNDFDKNYEYFRSYLYKKDYESTMKYAGILLDSGNENDVVSVFSQLVEYSGQELVNKFLKMQHNEEFNDVFSLLKSVAVGVYSSYDDAAGEIKGREYLDCEYLDLIRGDFTGRARDFIEKYINSECPSMYNKK